MSKLIKCDRCGKVDNGLNIVNCGTEGFFVGKIEYYEYSNEPEFRTIDLCQSCHAELNKSIHVFMEQKTKDGDE